MTIQEKMLKAYFKAAEALDGDRDMTISAHAFHRNKKYAFFVEARRLDEDGRLQDEPKSVVEW